MSLRQRAVIAVLFTYTHSPAEHFYGAGSLVPYLNSSFILEVYFFACLFVKYLSEETKVFVMPLSHKGTE